MKFNLRHQTRLEEKLGRAVLAKLFGFVGRGVINKYHIDRMSYEHNMNVFTVFTESSDREEPVEVIMERMVDSWYEETPLNQSKQSIKLKLFENFVYLYNPLIYVIFAILYFAFYFLTLSHSGHREREDQQ